MKWKPKVQYRDPATLIPYSKNAKVHSKKQIEKIAGAISAFGFTQPIVVDKGGVIIAGHGRREAALQLLLKEVPVVVAEHLTEEEVIAARIADNKVSEAPWDSDMLKFDLQTLKLKDFKLELTGFELPDLKNFLDTGEVKKEVFGETAKVEALTPSIDKKPEPKSEEDSVPEKVEERVKLGQVWELGSHRLMCGDSTNEKNIKLLINKNKMDIVFTDPPYGINLKIGDGNGNGLAKKSDYKYIKNDDSVECAVKSYKICESLKIEQMIFWGANYYIESLKNSKCWIAWDKRGDLPDDDFCGTELAWTNTSKHSKTIKVMWKGMIKEGESDKRIHPNQKPLLLIEKCFEYLNSKTNVLDLFGGSGSTLIACEKTNRKCFMMELDPHYCNVILSRWEAYTGKRAKLVSDKL